MDSMMKIWLHCNVGCGQFLRSSPNCRFVFTSCGHVVCENCAKKVIQNVCPVPVCKKSMKMVSLTEAPPDVKSYFMEPIQVINQHLQQRQQQQQQLQQQQQQLLQQQQQLLQQQESLMKQQQHQEVQYKQQLQRISQILSFQKQQCKSVFVATDQMKQHQARKLKLELETASTECKILKQKLHNLEVRKENHSRQGEISNQRSDVFQTEDSRQNSVFRSPLPGSLFDSEQQQQRPSFVQNNLFGGNKTGLQHSSNNQSQRQLPQTFGQFRSSFDQVSTPAARRNTVQSSRLDLGSLGHQNQEVIGNTAVRFKSPAVQPPRLHTGTAVNGRISLIRNQPNMLRSPASDVGSSMAGIGGISPAMSVTSLNYFTNKRFC